MQCSYGKMLLGWFALTMACSYKGILLRRHALMVAGSYRGMLIRWHAFTVAIPVVCSNADPAHAISCSQVCSYGCTNSDDMSKGLLHKGLL